MIVGIGMDMIEISRVKKACSRELFLNRYYTKEERKLIAADSKKAAGNFAVKEAVAKLLGTGFREAEPIEIETLRDGLGQPYVNLYGKAREISKKMEIDKIHVTITNTREYAAAFVVGEQGAAILKNEEMGKETAEKQ